MGAWGTDADVGLDSIRQMDEQAKDRAFGLLGEADSLDSGALARAARESGRDSLLAIPRDQWDAEIGLQFANACLRAKRIDRHR